MASAGNGDGFPAVSPRPTASQQAFGGNGAAKPRGPTDEARLLSQAQAAADAANAGRPSSKAGLIQKLQAELQVRPPAAAAAARAHISRRAGACACACCCACAAVPGIATGRGEAAP